MLIRLISIAVDHSLLTGRGSWFGVWGSLSGTREMIFVDNGVPDRGESRVEGCRRYFPSVTCRSFRISSFLRHLVFGDDIGLHPVGGFLRLGMRACQYFCFRFFRSLGSQD